MNLASTQRHQIFKELIATNQYTGRRINGKIYFLLPQLLHLIYQSFLFSHPQDLDFQLKRQMTVIALISQAARRKARIRITRANREIQEYIQQL